MNCHKLTGKYSSRGVIAPQLPIYIIIDLRNESNYCLVGLSCFIYIFNRPFPNDDYDYGGVRDDGYNLRRRGYI